MGLRTKLIIISFLIIGVSAIPSGILINDRIRVQLQNVIQSNLERHALTLVALVESAPDLSTPENMKALLDLFAESTGNRVTLIADDGVVLADSGLSLSASQALDNHGSRPEVIAAREAGMGIAIRFSDTLQEEMMYCAFPYQRDNTTGIVRVALPLTDIKSSLNDLKPLFMTPFLIGLLLAVIIVFVAAQLMSSALGTLLGQVKKELGQRGRKLDSSVTHDELGDIKGTFDAMAEEMEKAIQTLSSERDRIKGVLEGLSNGVIALDESDNIVLYNDIAARYLRLKPASVGQRFSHVVKNEDIHRLLEFEESGISVSQQDEIEVFIPEPHLLLIGITCIEGEGTVIVLQDVTQLRRLETMRRDFVANVSHELRTPVSVVRANAEVLLDGAMDDEPEQARRFTDAILRNADRLSRIIADLLDISRIESGEYSFEIESFNILELASRTVDSFEHMAAEKGTELVLEVPETAVLKADKKALEQILVNLIENAIKYSPDGSRVIISAEQIEKITRLEVIDNGPGISLEHHDRIFERFYRVDPGRSKQMGGTGLGLSIVRNLASAMGANVGVRQAEQTGSVFYIEFEESE